MGNHPYLKKGRYSLADADEQGMLLKMTCRACKVSHLYVPADLLPFVGKLILPELDDTFRCEGCGRKDAMRADWHTVHQPDIPTTRVRRLVRVKSVRVFEWEERAL